MKLARFLAVCLAYLACFSAAATIRETQVLNAVDSNGPPNSPANQIRTFTLAGGYTLGRIDFSGTLTSVHSATQLQDARVLITAPGGATYTLQPFTSTSTFTSQPFSVSAFLPTVADPSGLWTLRFYEFIDNGGTGQVDARWNLTIAFTDEPATPPSATDLGVLASPGASPSSQSLSPSQVRWFRFTLGCAIDEAIGSFLDVDPSASIINGTSIPNDMELALYDGVGHLVATDDDDGPGALSQLSFGAGTRPPVSNGAPFDGRDGPLAPGVYYVAVSAYDTTHRPLIWDATSTSNGGGTISLAIRTNVGTGTVPTISQQPEDVTAAAGSQATFSVTSSGATAFQWRKGGVSVVDGPAPGGGVYSGATTQSLSISAVGDADAGAYSVRVMNGCGLLLSSNAVLTVVPACDPDVNCDGTINGFDIEATEQAVNGDYSNFCQPSADLNNDGAENGFDIETEEQRVNGAPC